MSGPKGGSYRVESAAEREARLLRAAESAEQSVLRRIEEFERECATVVAVYDLAPIGVTVPKRARREAAAVQQWAADAEAALSAGQAELSSRVAAARSERVLGALGGLARFVAPASDEPVAVSRSKARQATADADAWRDEVSASVERSIRSIDADCSDAVHEAAQALAQQVLDATSLVRARQLSTLLGNDVGRANRAAREARKRRARTEQLLIALGAWDHPATNELHARLTGDAMDTVDLASLEGQVRDAVDQAAADRDRAVVAASIRRSLQAQGYVVEEGFETLVVSDGIAHVRAVGWSDHAVRVRMFPDRPRVAFNVVVREGDASEVRDAEVEREWCGDIADLLSTMEEDGVALELTHRTDPGSAPVQEVAADDFPFNKRAERRAATRKAKEQST